MNKDIVEYKENFISKIKKMFRNLFSNREKIQDNTNTEKMIRDVENNTFKENIIVKHDEEELKVIKLQKEYKAGKIFEEDMTDEERSKLIELYQKQNKELKEKIEIKRNRIRKRLDELKVS